MFSYTINFHFKEVFTEQTLLIFNHNLFYSLHAMSLCKLGLLFFFFLLYSVFCSLIFIFSPKNLISSKPCSLLLNSFQITKINMATNPKINGKFDIIGLVIKVCFHFFKITILKNAIKKYKMKYLENVSNCLIKKKLKMAKSLLKEKAQCMFF